MSNIPIKKATDDKGNQIAYQTPMKAVIDENGNTPADLVRALEDAGYMFAGTATPATNPGTPTQKIFYIASETGTYTNFNAIELRDGLSVLMWNGSWSSQQILISSNRFGYNVTVFGLVTGVHTLATAVRNVPSTERFGGQKITFKTDSGWVTYQNTSLDISDYENVTNWVLDSGVSELGDVAITNNPDYEDLTQNERGQLKFADKTYDAATYTGLGRKYLRKNIAGGVNTLTQDMLVDANTIYHIQYDYTLGENITIPKNCILEFDGGSISGEHTITGNKTYILEQKNSMLGITLNGTFKNEHFNIESFGSEKDNPNIDTSIILKRLLAIDKKILFPIGAFYFSELHINNNEKINIEGVGENLNGNYKTSFYPYNNNQHYIIKIGGTSDFSVNSFTTLNDAVNGFVVKNINFSDSNKPLTEINGKKALLAIDFAMNGFLSISSIFAHSKTLHVIDSWECIFDNISVRSSRLGIGNFCISFTTSRTDIGANISACLIRNIDFEDILGGCLNFIPSFASGNNYIQNISLEDNQVFATSKNILTSKNVSGFIKNELFRFDAAESTKIENISIQNAISCSYELENNANTYYNSVGVFKGVVVNSICSNGGYVFINGSDNVSTIATICNILTSNENSTTNVDNTLYNYIVLSGLLNIKNTNYIITTGDTITLEDGIYNWFDLLKIKRDYAVSLTDLNIFEITESERPINDKFQIAQTEYLFPLKVKLINQLRLTFRLSCSYTTYDDNVIIIQKYKNNIVTETVNVKGNITEKKFINVSCYVDDCDYFMLKCPRGGIIYDAIIVNTISPIRTGAFSSKPSSALPGVQYFNTDTHKLITYAEDKWWNPDGTEALS